MSTKRWKEIKGLTKDELVSKLREAEGNLFQTKMKQVTGQLADTASLWRIRKEIARMKTLQSQQDASQGSK